MPLIGALIDFVPGTTIVSGQVDANFAAIRTAYNDTAVMTDVARTITVSNVYTAQQRFADGLVGAPGISFNSDQDCGLYRIGANNIGLSLGGAKVVDYSAAGVAITGTFTVSGVASFPGGLGAVTVASLNVTGTSVLGGNVGVGGSTNGSIAFFLRTPTLITADQYGVWSAPVFTSAATNSGVGVYVQPQTAAAAFTIGSLYGIQVADPVKGAGSTVSVAYGIRIFDITVGATNVALYTGTGQVRFGDVVTIVGAATLNSTLLVSGTSAFTGAVVLTAGLTAGDTLKASKFIDGAFEGFWINNQHTGTAAYSALRFQHNGGSSFIYHFGSGYTSAGMYSQAGFVVEGQGAGGLALIAKNAAGVIKFGTGATPTEYMRLTSTGELIVGHTFGLGVSTGVPKLQAHGIAAGQGGIVLFGQFSADGSGACLTLTKSRGATPGTYTAVALNDIGGRIDFTAADGGDISTSGARIQTTLAAAGVDNRVPMHLQFFTAPGASDHDLTERFRITSGGDVGIAATKKFFFDGVNAAGNTYLLESSADTITMFCGAVQLVSFTGTGMALTSGKNLWLDGGGDTYLIESAANDLKVVAGGVVGFGVLATGAYVPATQKLFLDGGGDTYFIENSANVITLFCGAVQLATFAGTGLALTATKSLWFDGGGDTYISETSSNVLDFVVGAAVTLKLTSTRVQFGTFSANADAPVTGYIIIKDAGGTDRKLAIIA